MFTADPLFTLIVGPNNPLELYPKPEIFPKPLIFAQTFCAVSVVAVSYTHLDVYKRQV